MPTRRRILTWAIGLVGVAGTATVAVAAYRRPAISIRSITGASAAPDQPFRATVTVLCTRGPSRGGAGHLTVMIGPDLVTGQFQLPRLATGQTASVIVVTTPVSPAFAPYVGQSYDLALTLPDGATLRAGGKLTSGPSPTLALTAATVTAAIAGAPVRASVTVANTGGGKWLGGSITVSVQITGPHTSQATAATLEIPPLDPGRSVDVHGVATTSNIEPGAGEVDGHTLSVAFHFSGSTAMASFTVSGIAPVPLVKMVASSQGGSVAFPGYFIEGVLDVINLSSADAVPAGWGFTSKAIWKGRVLGTYDASGFGAIPPSHTIYPLGPMYGPIPYMPGMANGDPVQVTYVGSDGSTATVSMTLGGVSGLDPAWSIVPLGPDGNPVGQGAIADAWHLTPVGQTLSMRLRVTRRANSTAVGMAYAGVSMRFVETPTYTHETDLFVPVAVTLAAGASTTVTVQSQHAFEGNVYAVDNITLTCVAVLSTGQELTYQQPFVPNV